MYGDLSPRTIRRYWRASSLKPEEFLQVFAAFGPVVGSRKVEFLFRLFLWASRQGSDFRHLPDSRVAVVSMLTRARRFGDAESLLPSAANESVALHDANLMYSEIIQGYAEACELEKSVALYDRARERGLAPSGECYRALLDLSIKLKSSEVAVRVYRDMLDAGLVCDGRFMEFVVGSLSKDGRTLEAVNVVSRAKSFGIEASSRVLTTIAEGFCRKRDFDDMLSFLEEWKHIPEARFCNRIISSLCQHLGDGEAWAFAQRMESFGFELDAVNFGVLVSASCREKQLRAALVYLSECYSRSIIPKLYTYNALISGLFKVGMDKCAKEIFEDMVEKGLTPDLSTFRVLLAGYCMSRNFDEVKLLVGQMVGRGLISLAPAEDALSKAFAVLGLDRLGVKVKRDNNVRIPRAEFFDSLGNGLYLETDIDKYELMLSEILDSAVLPEFDSALLKECLRNDVEAALRVKDEAVQWGQIVSLSSYSELLKTLSLSSDHIRKAIDLLDEMPELSDQLDPGSLNLLIQRLTMNGMLSSTRLILDRLYKRELLVESETCTALITGFYKEGNFSGLLQCLEIVQKSICLPHLNAINILVSFLCKRDMFNPVLELFDNISEKCPDFLLHLCGNFLTELNFKGFTCIGYMLMEEIHRRGLVLDHTAYAVLTKGLMRGQKSSEALDIVAMLLERKLICSANIYHLLVPSLVQLGRVGEAIGIKKYVLSSRSEPAVSIYSTLVTELCQKGNIKEATYELKEMMKNNVFPDDITLNAFIGGYCRENNLGKALEVLCIMLRKHVELSIQGYRSLIRQMCVRGKVFGAMRLLKLMPEASVSQSLILYNILLFYLFQANNDSFVDSLLKNMQEMNLNPDANTYDILVYGFHKCGNVSKSADTLNIMISKGLRPSNRSIRTIIYYFCNNRNIDKVLQLSKIMESNRWKYSTSMQNALVGALLSCGRLREAECFLDHIEEDMSSKQVNYDFLIKQLCFHGRTPKAIDLLNIMLEKGNLPSEISYNSVIYSLCRCKLFDQALGFHAEMQQKNLTPSVLTCDALIYGLCVNGRPDDARRTLRLMLQFGPFPTQSMYNCIIDRYHAEKNLDKASEFLKEMQQAGYSPNFETHWSLISNLSCHSSKDVSNGGRKGFLSGLLSANIPPAKNHKGKDATKSKYSFIQS